MLVARRKLEIFIEAHALERVEAILGKSGLKGWSVFAGCEGAGLHGQWGKLVWAKSSFTCSSPLATSKLVRRHLSGWQAISRSILASSR